MVRTGRGVRHPTIAGFETVPEGFAKLDAFLDANDYRPAAGFTVVLPRYAIDDRTNDRCSPSAIHFRKVTPKTVTPDSAARMAVDSATPRARRAPSGLTLIQDLDAGSYFRA